MSEQFSIQPALPFKVDEDLHWFNTELVMRRGLLGKRAVSRLIPDPSTPSGLSETIVKISEIDKLTDQNLRYALRYADAARTIGLYVRIHATDQNFSSRLVEAVYFPFASSRDVEGRDSFTQELHRTPEYDEDY